MWNFSFLFCFWTDLIKFRFLIFWGQFWMTENSPPGPSEAEKLAGFGKKDHPFTSRGMVFRDYKKNNISAFSVAPSPSL